MSRNERHYLNEIINSVNELDHQALEHIKQCQSCHRELLMMRRLERAISATDTFPLPATLKATILERVLHPGLSLWQLLLGAMLTLISPLILQHLTLNHPGFNLDKNILIYLFVFYGTMLTLLLFVLTYRIFYSGANQKQNPEDLLDFLSSYKPEFLQRIFK